MISLALVTHNRGAIVADSLASVLGCRLVTEVVWVDNASDEDEYTTIAAALGPPLLADLRLTMCSCRENHGAGWALNRAFALATNDLILVTDGDIRLGPRDLALMEHTLAVTPRRLAVAIYPREPDSVPERYRGPWFTEHWDEGTVTLARGLPMLCNLFRRELLEIAGWMREDFGLVEWNDNEWAERALFHAVGLGFECLAFADRSCVHIPDENTTLETPEYWAKKVGEFEDKSKPARILELKAQGYPTFNPFR